MYDSVNDDDEDLLVDCGAGTISQSCRRSCRRKKLPLQLFWHKIHNAIKIVQSWIPSWILSPLVSLCKERLHLWYHNQPKNGPWDRGKSTITVRHQSLLEISLLFIRNYSFLLHGWGFPDRWQAHFSSASLWACWHTTFAPYCVNVRAHVWDNTGSVLQLLLILKLGHGQNTLTSGCINKFLDGGIRPAQRCW